MSNRILSREESINAFFNAQTFEELNHLMYLVIDQKVWSPIEQFEQEPNDFTGDLDWWDHPSIQLIKKINELGVITVETDGERCFDKPNLHCRMSEQIICPRNMIPLMNVYFRDKNIIVIPGVVYDAGRYIEDGVIFSHGEYIPVLEAGGELIEIETYKDDNDQSQNIAEPFILIDNQIVMRDSINHYFGHVVNPYLLDELYRNCITVDIMDLVWDRRPDAPDGLFSQIIAFLELFG